MFEEYDGTDPAQYAPSPTDPTPADTRPRMPSSASETVAQAPVNNSDPVATGVSTQRSSAAAERPQSMQPATWPLPPNSSSLTGTAAGDALINGTLTDDIGRLGAIVGESLASGRPLLLGSKRCAAVIIGTALLEAVLISKVVDATGVKSTWGKALVTVAALLATTALTGYVVATMEQRTARETAAAA